MIVLELVLVLVSGVTVVVVTLVFACQSEEQRTGEKRREHRLRFGTTNLFESTT